MIVKWAQHGGHTASMAAPSISVSPMPESARVLQISEMPGNDGFLLVAANQDYHLIILPVSETQMIVQVVPR